MPASISFEADISQLQRELPDWASRRIPSITRNALNDTIEEARFAEVGKIRGVFDRPKPLTERAPLYRKATSDNLVAEVYIRPDGASGTPPARYILPQVEGGARKAKPFEKLLRARGVMRADEFALPAIGQQRDAYGNLPGSLIVRILSQLQAMREVGSLANETARSRKRKAKRALPRYFVPTGARQERGIGRLPRGIYERQGNRIRAVMVFVRQPRYAKRYDFGQATIAKAQRVFEPYWLRHFYAELAKQTSR